MYSYRSQMEKQFYEANGFYIGSIYNPTTIEEISSWIEERKKTADICRDVLDFYDIKYKSFHTAELDKGVDDSIVLGHGDATLITPYIKKEEVRVKNPIISRGVDIDRDHVFFLNFITSNPYDTKELSNLSYLYYEQKRCVVLSMFGKQYDKDRTKKMSIARLMAKDLSGSSEKYISVKDNYIYLVISKPKVKTKNMTR